MDYYLQYVLGWRGPSNKRADIGTIAHKVLEILAIAKKTLQDGRKMFDDEIIGRMHANIHDGKLEKIIDKCFAYYTKEMSHHIWSLDDYNAVRSSVMKAISYGGGIFDPRNRKIVAPELHFDITIDKPWSHYSYDFKGEKLEGQLALKGTIDLITEAEAGVYEVIDWKTGRRLNWATGEEKTQEKLKTDPQLRIYHYALSKIYPEIEQILVTIFFINDGGPFTLCFTPSDLAYTEDMIKRKFEIIKSTTLPRLNKDWKCQKLCHQGKTSFEGTRVKSVNEFRRGQVCVEGQPMTKCEQTKWAIEKAGIDMVTEKYMAPNHNIGHYKPPGSLE